MNFQLLWRHIPVTVILIAVIVGVAVCQLVFGVSIDEPSSADLVRFGANFLPLSLMGEWWRIVTSVFLHIGLIHLLFNGFAVYYFGQVVERIVGGAWFLVVFLWSAVGGNLLNLFITWQGVLDGNAVGLSAGASGGIMGLGAFLFMLAVLKAPMAFMLNTKSLAMIMAINLVMGFALPGIDNAAHIGGACVGAVLGVVVSMVLRATLPRVGFWACVVALMVGFGLVWWYLHGQVLLHLGYS